MKGDFTRFTHDPAKHYSSVLKQQGRVDLDADWNEAVQLLIERKRTMISDVVGRCGVPVHDNGFEVDRLPDGSDLTIAPGRIYVDGILCEFDAEGPVSISEQPDLPGYEPPTGDGVYVAYVDVWERHITYHQDPEIREVALGGPDTATRTRVLGQIRLAPLDIDEPLHDLECVPAPVDPSTGRLSAHGAIVEDPATPCAVPAGGGYRGLENRLYRVEIHDDGSISGTPTFKWSRDNGSVVLPVAESGIAGDEITVARLGFDDVLTVRVDDWVEILGDETELNLQAGTLARIVPDGIDRADLEITVDRDVSAHATESHPIVRRWDQQATSSVALSDGAVPIQAGPFELEDGLFVEFDPAGTYQVGDYWLIPARTREGAVLWPTEGPADTPVSLLPFGIQHHYCTLALVRRQDDAWTEVKDCRPLFPPLTEVDDGCCCETVEPGDDIQQAIDTVAAAGGGCISLCEGVHEVNGPLVVHDATDIRITGEGNATVLLLNEGEQEPGGLYIVDSRRISVERLFAASNSVESLISVLHDADQQKSREISFAHLTLLNTRASNREDSISSAIRLAHVDGVDIDSCRMAAEAGIVGLWGNELPDLSGAMDADPESDGPEVVEITFEDLEQGATFEVGETFTTEGVDVTCEAFTEFGGETSSGGEAVVDTQGGEAVIAIGSGLNLSFDMGPGYQSVRAGFSFGGGTLNLRVNGQLQVVDTMLDLDGLTMGGVRVGVTQTVNGSFGLLSLDEETAPITDFAFGGSEFALSNVIFRGVDEQPQPPEIDLTYGDGVRNLRMQESEIRFVEFGVLAAYADTWHVDTTGIRPVHAVLWEALDPVADLTHDVMADVAATVPHSVHTVILDRLELLFATDADDLSGVGILSCFWLNSTVERSVVAGDTAMLTWLQLDGIIDRNEFSAGDLGVGSFWTSRSTWADNTVKTISGPCLGFGGCTNVNIHRNRLNGPSGMANMSTSAGLFTLLVIGNALGRAYRSSEPIDNMAILWIIVEDLADLLGLRNLLDALQMFIPDGFPAGLFLAAILTSRYQSKKSDSKSSFRLPIGNIDIRDNDFSCESHCLFLDRFLPLGSIRLSDNRIQTVTGQAVSVHATPFFANAHLFGLLARWLFKAALKQLRRSELESTSDTNRGLLSAATDLMQRWSRGIERFLEFDFRIESNTIRSLRTAIESNLFELAILDNHITLQERSLEGTVAPGTLFGTVTRADGTTIANATIRVDGTPRVVTTRENGTYEIAGLPAGSYSLTASAALMNPASESVELESEERLQVDFELEEGALGDYNGELIGYIYTGEVMEVSNANMIAPNSAIGEMISALDGSSAFEPLAAALREGAHTNPTYLSTYLLSDEGPLSTAVQRADAASAVAVIGGIAVDPELKSAASTVDQSLRNNDETLLAAILPRFIELLMAMVDSKGILLKGLGGRIVGNQIIVPADVDQRTESQGGIQLSVSYMEAMIAVILGQWLLGLLGSNKRLDPDPLLGVTESLIDNNEIIGGISHGISVQGVAGVPDLIGDLNIRDNQIRGCGGSGILIDEHGFVAGLDISGNHVLECGRRDSFSKFRNGVTIQNAGICVIRDNTVRQCGVDAGQSAFGLSLESIYGLRMHDNDILSNGSAEGSPDDGGARLAEVYGAASVQDNNISYNNGHALSWANSARTGEDAFLPKPLMDFIDLYLRIQRGDESPVDEDQVTIQGNLFNAIRSSGLVLFNLMNIGELNFSGNSCRSNDAGPPLGEIKQSALAVITGNLLHTNASTAISIKKVSAGIVSGNVGNKSIDIQFSGVQSSLNEPPTT